MRIVAVADTHTFESDLGALPDGDVFVHAGDLLRGGTIKELEGVASWIRELPHTHKVIIAGNHDWCFARERAQALDLLGDAHYLEDSGVCIEGVDFWGSPWQPAYNDWAYNLPRGAPLAEKWALIPTGTHVLITHSPPAGFGDRGPVPGRLGCVDLRARLEAVQPALHMFGHIHQDGGAWQHDATCFANVTTWECERGASVFDYDVLSGKASPVSIPPAKGRAQ